MANPSKRTRKGKSQEDIRRSVTETLLNLMQEGDLPPWRKGFAPANVNYPGPVLPHNLSTQKGYSGINFVLTLAQSQANEYSTNAWATFKQMKALGGSVNKGEKGTKVVFFGALLKDKQSGSVINLDQMSREQVSQLSKEDIVRIPFLREYVVFNADQASGLDAHLGIDAEGSKRLQVPQDVKAERDMAVVEAFIEHLKGTGLTINFIPQIRTASYELNGHVIRMAPMEQYESLPRFLSTLAHEAGHSTMGMLERPCAIEGITDENRVREELVAEIAAAMTVAQLGLPFEAGNSACYIETWQQRDAMAGDPNLIMEACREADKAVRLLLTDAFMEQVAGIDARFGVNQVDTRDDLGLDDPLSDFDLGAAVSTASAMLNNFEVSDDDAIAQALALASEQALSGADHGVDGATVQPSAVTSGPETDATSAQQEKKHAFEPARFITIAADTVAALRKIDVFRVLDQSMEVPEHDSAIGSPVKEMADFICQHREDLIEEVVEVMKEELEIDYQPRAQTSSNETGSETVVDPLEDDPFVTKARTQSLADFMS